jgi:hypothetical protein
VGAIPQLARRSRSASLLIIFVAVCVAALFGYSFLIGVHTYEIKKAVGDHEYRVVKVIGGFRTTSHVEEILSAHRAATVQQALAGSAYDVDRVWTRASRAAAKLCSVIAYFALTVSGTLALASAAILVSNNS